MSLIVLILLQYQSFLLLYQNVVLGHKKKWVNSCLYSSKVPIKSFFSFMVYSFLFFCSFILLQNVYSYSTGKFNTSFTTEKGMGSLLKQNVVFLKLLSLINMATNSLSVILKSISSFLSKLRYFLLARYSVKFSFGCRLASSFLSSLLLH